MGSSHSVANVVKNTLAETFNLDFMEDYALIAHP